MGDQVFGDKIQQSGDGTNIGKVDLRGAHTELAELIESLRQTGLVNSAGDPTDSAAVETEVSRRSGRLSNLFKAVKQGAGPSLREATTGTISDVIVKAIKALIS